MKTFRTVLLPAAVALTVCALLVILVWPGFAQAPQPNQPPPDSLLAVPAAGFTYQGRLDSSGQPFNGVCDFQFGLWDAPSAGVLITGPVTNLSVTVANGLFDTLVNLPNSLADAAWLQIAVRCPAGSGTYTTLTSRTQMTPAPFAAGLRFGTTVKPPASGGIVAPGFMVLTGEAEAGFTNPAAIIGAAGQTLASINTGAGYPADSMGVYGVSDTGYGVYGYTASGTGVMGVTNSGSFSQAGVVGHNLGSGPGTGVYGYSTSDTGQGVYGNSTAGTGVLGISFGGDLYEAGVTGKSLGTSGGPGVYGYAPAQAGNGVFGEATGTTGTGVLGIASNGIGSIGVNGISANGTGVYAQSAFGNALFAFSSTGQVIGASGNTPCCNANVRISNNGSAVALWASTTVNNAGIFGQGGSGIVGEAIGNGGVGVIGRLASGISGLAGQFLGNIDVTGSVLAPSVDMHIDHPQDPTQQYLNQAAVYAPEMMNMYSGNAVTDGNGYAQVKLPGYIEALNTDFRYQLTVVGQFAQAIVAAEISNGTFTIQTDKPNVKVSWQVSGVRQDAYALANPLAVEQAKPAAELGLYLHPSAFGMPPSLGAEMLYRQMARVDDSGERPRR